MSRDYSDLTLKLLFGLSGQICPFPGCTNFLIETGDLHDPAVLGQIAHIEASSDEGPRANPALPQRQRNQYPNLVLMCRHHHGLADAVESVYTVDEMRRWKSDGEHSARERWTSGLSKVTFAELKVTCDGIAQPNVAMPSSALTAVPPHEKMVANGLSDQVGHFMALGLAQGALVGDFLAKVAGISPSFPQQLRAGFVAEYERLQQSGAAGDELFLNLWDFAAGSVTVPQDLERERWRQRSSALAVLCHLFEVCDVFEAPA